MQKKSVIIIICVLVLISIALIAVLVMKKENSGDSKEVVVSIDQSYQPKINLSLETEDGVTIIYATASIDGNNSIESIMLPNGETVEGDSAEYETSEAGEFEFTVIASNGNSTSKTVTVEDVTQATSDNPYLPDGFTHVSGTDVETGYVIEDDCGNQFVWVPVSTGILTRNTSSNTQYEESDSTATGFYNSVAKYYGFYIARYEASSITYDNVETIASVADVMPLSNINYTDSYEYARKMATVYGYSGVKTALVNSYAWDTTLKWIDSSVSSYSSSDSYGNYSGTILATGSTQTDEVNMICDLAGNLREWTTEIYYPAEATTEEDENAENIVDEEQEQEDVVYRVIRGGSANIKRYANSHGSNPEKTTDAYWGFRVVLYKD